MALFDRSKEKEAHPFPSLPAFLVRVEVRECNRYGDGHFGVFALEDVPKDTKFWVWTERVVGIPGSELRAYISNEYGEDRSAARIFLRQGFVLPGKDVFYTNPTDAGRYMNHSSDPNCGPDGTLRDIAAGEELTMDYSFHGNPTWYREICAEYGVETEAEVASKYQ